MRKISVALGGRASEIRIGRGLFPSLPQQLEGLHLRPPYLLVSQPRILSHIGRIEEAGFECVTIPEGERAKTLRTTKRLLDRMVSLRLGRDATAVALGGGVVGDVTGFAASIYLRGINVVQVPTTLLAQVDSSVGGKTGVNHAAGKNLIGTFYQPRLVIVDPDLLDTLPAREYRSGLYEAVKYGVIRDAGLFRMFEESLDDISARDPGTLEELVWRCLAIKADVVSADEREGNLRRILNFGHTVGHGIEAALGYQRLKHGEAVAYGMIAATRLARELDLLTSRSANRIESVVLSIGRLPTIGGLSASAVIEAMSHDKKVRRGVLHFVLPTRIGRVRIETEIPLSLIRDAVRSLL